MILRIVRGRILPGHRRRPARRIGTSFPQVRDLPGILQARMALRRATEGNEFAVISTWATPDAAMAVFGAMSTAFPRCLT